MIEALILSNRSCRRFHQHAAITLKTLQYLVDLARLSASAANLQPLKFILSSDPAINASIFSCLSWAAYLTDWRGPEDGERPAGYVILLGDTAIAKSFDIDCGIACQSILLGAREKGLAGCIIASIKRTELKHVLGIPDRFIILLAIAIGKPKETIVIETLKGHQSVKYWRDENGVHHVPKRPLSQILLKCYSNH